MKNRLIALTLGLLVGITLSPALAQETTGTPGSPSATTTIDGQLPSHPPPALRRRDRPRCQGSKPYWPPQIVPPKGAPNILLIMTDDQGYGVTGTFGGVIPTPAMDRIAQMGLRYTQFHSTALCSPTRAAIITGRNHHSVGFGVIAEQATGYPGYDSIIGIDNATIGEILKQNGYATSWFGKNHNTPDYQYSAAGPFDQWPTGMGFEYFYGFMGGETDQWTPFLFRNTTQIFPWRDQPGYNMITGMADDAIEYIKQLNAAAPDKPFFLYYVPGATHAPHQPTPEWIDKFKGKFDMGWNELREQIFANQKRLGVIPANTTLTPWPDGQPEYGGAKLPKWDTLSADEKKLFARQAEVFAAYVAYTDHEIGRVIQAVEDMGKLDNTLVIYISGDNGTSAEGSTLGTPFDMAALQGIDVPVADQLKFYDVWGSAADHSAHVGGVVVGVRHAVQMDQADRLAFRRHPAGHGHRLAQPHQGRRRHPHPVPPHDRHRADDPRSHRHSGAGDGQRHRAEADRRREHGLYLRQGERRRPVARAPRSISRCSAIAAIYHDGWYACTTPPAAPWLMGSSQDARRGQRLQMGTLQHRMRTTRRPTDPGSRRKCPTSCARCRSCSWSRPREVPGVPAGQCDSSSASWRQARAPPPGGTSSPTRARSTGMPNSDAPEHPRTGPTPSRRRSRFRRAAGTA